MKFNIDAAQIIQIAVMIAFMIGAAAFVVSVITQVIKEWPGLKDIPTAGVVIALSLVLCPAAYAVSMAYLGQPIEWPIILACVIAGFFVALVAMEGWDAVKGIWDRTRYPEEIEEK